MSLLYLFKYILFSINWLFDLIFSNRYGFYIPDLYLPVFFDCRGSGFSKGNRDCARAKKTRIIPAT